jgi:hypothetical protein
VSKILIRKNLKNKRINLAVSEIIGTLLLLLISVSLFSVVYINILIGSPSPIKPSVNLICTLEKNNITLKHCGGKTLDLDTEIITNINGTTTKFIVNDYMNNGSRKNGVWNIGEQVVYPAGNVTNKKVSASVVDKHSNSVILSVVLQR